jgi:hypothetical protein
MSDSPTHGHPSYIHCRCHSQNLSSRHARASISPPHTGGGCSTCLIDVIPFHDRATHQRLCVGCGHRQSTVSPLATRPHRPAPHATMVDGFSEREGLGTHVDWCTHQALGWEVGKWGEVWETRLGAPWLAGRAAPPHRDSLRWASNKACHRAGSSVKWGETTASPWLCVVVRGFVWL